MLDELIVLSVLLLPMAAPANAQQVSIGIGTPNVSIGINVPLYPDLVPVPGYPVYYAPAIEGNYFFYDGMYWVYQNDNWYASSWYNGPWGLVDPEVVPLFVLRVPVRYYCRPPIYFHDWRQDAPPRWGDHWGNNWAQRRNGWDHWDHHAVPARPPLPTYQRNYAGDRYPHADQQRTLQERNYHYQPRDPVVRQQYQAGQVPRAQAPRPVTPERNTVQQGNVQTSKQLRPVESVPAPSTPREQQRQQRTWSDQTQHQPQKPRAEPVPQTRPEASAHQRPSASRSPAPADRAKISSTPAAASTATTATATTSATPGNAGARASAKIGIRKMIAVRNAAIRIIERMFGSALNLNSDWNRIDHPINNESGKKPT